MARPTKRPTKRTTKRSSGRTSTAAASARNDAASSKRRVVAAPIIDADTPAWAALNNHATTRQEDGDIEGAIEELTASIELAPNEVAPRYNRGNARSLGGDLEGALADYTDALSVDPTFAPAWQRRGLTRQRMGDVEGALHDLNEAIRLAPDEPSALGERAALRALQADFEGAVRDCELALSIAPADWKHRGGAEHLLKTIRKAEAAHVEREDVEHADEKNAKKKNAKKSKKDGAPKDHEHKEDTENQAPAAVIEDVLERAGWAYQQAEDEEGYIDFITMVEGDPLIEATVVRLSEELERVVLYALMRPKAKKERRAEVAELVTRANYGMGDGNFEMDFDDGSLRFKIALDFSDVPLSPLLVRNMILNVMDTLEVYETAFLHVIAGKAKAKAAVRAAEKAAEQAGDFS